MEEVLYSVRQASILLKVHPLTVRRYIRDGKLKAVKIGGNIRIPESYLDQFSAEVEPTNYGLKLVSREKVNEFSLNDSIFRLKGKAISLRRL